MSLSHRCGWILAPSSLQNCFNSATLEGFKAWKNCLRSCHSISIRFKPRLWLGHSKTLILFHEPFRGGLSDVFRIIVLLHKPSALELEVTNWRLDILLQDFLKDCRIHGSINYGSSRFWSCKAAPDHHTTPHHVWLLVWCSFYEILCWFYARYNGTHTFQKLQLLSLQSTEYLPKVLGIIKMFFGKCVTSLCVLFGQQWLLPWNSPMDDVFAQSLSFWWIMNTDLNWGKWDLQFFRCCSGFFDFYYRHCALE